MKILESVLLAIDLNDEHESLLERASSIAHVFGNRIIIMHVISDELKGSSVQNIAEKYVKKELKVIKDSFAFQGIREVDAIYRYGNTVDEIIGVSEKENVSTIMVGSGKNYDPLNRVPGQKALQIIRNSRKPVIVMRSEEKGEIKQIVCPVDCSEPSRLSLKSAILTAKKYNAKLQVICVFEPLFISSPRLLKSGIDEREENEKRRAIFEKEFEIFINEFDFLELNHETHILSGDIPEMIVEFVRKNRIDLMYIGSSGKTGLRRRLLGSVTEKVLKAIPSHMLVTKSEEVFKLQMATEIEDIEMHYKRALELRELGYYQEALREYRICTRINSMFIPAIKSMASLYDKLGESEQATYFQDLANSIFQKISDRKIEAEIRKNYHSGN